MPMMWISVLGNDGKSIGMILLSGADIRGVNLPDIEDLPDEYKKDAIKTPKNIFMTKEEMSKYIDLANWS